jgi:hypothetical protein
LSRHLGDFQTPPALVAEIIDCLGPIGNRWTRVLEPTCGRGNFVRGLLESSAPPLEIQALELQDSHVEVARKLLKEHFPTRVLIRKANVFDLNLDRDLQWSNTGPLLVIGNPPWVTNSELGALGSSNLPSKTNIKGLSGIEALTGDSNFDIAEYLWLKLIEELAHERPTIALLCKTSVARNLLRFASKVSLPVTRVSIRKIEAKKWFGASVEACLFRMEIGPEGWSQEVDVFPDLRTTESEAKMGFVNGRLVADVSAHKRSAFADGISPVTWRQGIKHDAASVMELNRGASGDLTNKLGEVVDVEPEYVYPLLKSTDLFHQTEPKRCVLVTQRKLSDDTHHLRWTAPRLWAYLEAHSDSFAKRKSTIYRNKPAFAMFGVGDYSFSSYKVGISGLHKTCKFRAIGPVSGKPVMLDDTGYFVACDSAQQAILLSSLLNDPLCLELIYSMTFTGSKRPITKKLLQRVDLRVLLDQIDKRALLVRAKTEAVNLNVPADWLSTLEATPLAQILFPEPMQEVVGPQMSLGL